MTGGLKAVADAYADSIIKAVMQERMIGGEDFWKSKSVRSVAARRRAIKRLQREGFTFRHIAELMKCSLTAVQYQLSDKAREYRRTARVKRYAIAKQAAEART
jgi:G:T-mismatch repair DNA endonuclease (very short patch repair protein)